MWIYQKKLESNLSEHLKLNIHNSKLKQWYNGYNFLGSDMYNPFDILQFIQNDFLYKNYWFETGTPTFLIKLIRANNYFLPNLSNLTVDERLLSNFEIEITGEDVTNKGRIDLTVKIENFVYIIEFKVSGTTDALTQIKEKNYHQKYLQENKEIFLVGFEFDKVEKNISKFEWEKVKNG